MRVVEREKRKHVDALPDVPIKKENIPTIEEIEDMGADLGAKRAESEIVSDSDIKAVEIGETCRILQAGQERGGSRFKLEAQPKWHNSESRLGRFVTEFRFLSGTTFRNFQFRNSQSPTLHSLTLALLWITFRLHHVHTMRHV